MDPLQMLERYYKTFIEEENPKAFFLGMADYLDYANTLPEFERIKKGIAASQKPSTQEVRELERSALVEIHTAKIEIEKYVKKHGIEDPVVKRALNDYDEYFTGTTLSSGSMPSLLHEELCDVVMALDKLPEHQAFARCFVEMSKPNGARVSRYLPIKAADDFFTAVAKLQRGQQVELWGHLQSIQSRYEVIRHGHDTRLALVERSRRGESQATWELLNYTGIMHEWKQIEDEEIQRGAIYFVVSSVRPLVTRLHNYVLGHWNEPEVKKEMKKEMEPALFFDPDKSRLHIQGREIKIQKFRDQYHLLRIIFENPKDTPQEWFFSEVIERIDPTYTDEKRYYNAAYQIRRKLAENGLPDFFITTRQSAKINPRYLS